MKLLIEITLRFGAIPLLLFSAFFLLAGFYAALRKGRSFEPKWFFIIWLLFVPIQVVTIFISEKMKTYLPTHQLSLLLSACSELGTTESKFEECNYSVAILDRRDLQLDIALNNLIHQVDRSKIVSLKAKDFEEYRLEFEQLYETKPLLYWFVGDRFNAGG